MIAEFRWIPNSFTKNIELPNLVWEPQHNEYGGKYSWYEDRNEKPYITLVENTYSETYTIESTIMHEFCHHIQYVYNRKIPNVYMPSFDYENYEDHIYKYFTANPNEYEALLFENKYAKCENNEYWLRKLIWKK
jgi:hypothetical protein